MPESKAAIRKHFLQIRKSIPEPAAQDAAVKAADNFLNYIKMDGVKTIAFYHPINGEIDPIPLFERLLSNAHLPLYKRLFVWLAGKSLLRPLVGRFKSNRESVIFSLPTIVNKNEHLLFHKWKIGEGLVSSTIYPQLLESASRVGHVIPDLILVPLVVFDENCNRIGYGGGFYDRTISNMLENKLFPLKVGYAYECQKSNEKLPVDINDMQLDFVVTEKTMYSKS